MVGLIPSGYQPVTAAAFVQAGDPHGDVDAAAGQPAVRWRGAESGGGEAELGERGQAIIEADLLGDEAILDLQRPLSFREVAASRTGLRPPQGII